MLCGLVALLLLVASGACGQDVPDSAAPAPSKVGTVLSALYEELAAHERQGDTTAFAPSGPMIRVIEDRVFIDAVASGETDVLRMDLEALGMQKAASFGRMVSGQLPIRAIADVNALESLQFARPAGAATGDVRSGTTPQAGTHADTQSTYPSLSK